VNKRFKVLGKFELNPAKLRGEILLKTDGAPSTTGRTNAFTK